MIKLTTLIILMVSAILGCSKIACASDAPQTTFLIEHMDDVRHYNEMFVKMTKLPTDTPITVHLNSSGGLLQIAYGLASQMNRLKTTCYIKHAESAALEIVMPTCKKSFATKDSKFAFHDIHVVVPADPRGRPLLIGAKDGFLMHRDLMLENNLVIEWMRFFYGSDAIGCTKEQMAKWSDFSKTCTGFHLFENSKFTGASYNSIWPTPVVEIIDEKDFPQK